MQLVDPWWHCRRVHLQDDTTATEPTLMRAIINAKGGFVDDVVDQLRADGDGLVLDLLRVGVVEGALLVKVLDGQVSNLGGVDNTVGAHHLQMDWSVLHRRLTSRLIAFALGNHTWIWLSRARILSSERTPFLRSFISMSSTMEAEKGLRINISALRASMTA